MALIKSALELALEKTKDIQGDKTSLLARSYKEEGMKLFHQLSENADLDIEKRLQEFSEEQLTSVREGLFTVVMNRIQLPSSELATADLLPIERALSALMPKKKEIKGIKSQLEEFYTRYLEDRDQLHQAIMEQYAPILRQKEQQLGAQTGQRVRLTPEQDPEFQGFVKKNVERLDSQYNDGINALKEQLEQMFSSL
ncbi:MAG: hypothetical protein GW949_08115 [Spirochaetales bacterium]|nr:hypothetical protein [Spirochaetales bacterium]